MVNSRAASRAVRLLGWTAAALLGAGLAAQTPSQPRASTRRPAQTRVVPQAPARTQAETLSQAQQQPPPPTQAKPQEPPQQPSFRVATNFVQVDVYPTTGGRPVTDLTVDEFEVLEDGRLQKIESIMQVVTRAAGPEALRVDPSNVEAANQAAADPGTRIFVLFLDSYHVEWTAAHQIRQPLQNMLNRIIGQDDLVAVMLPQMSAAALTFTRRMQSIEAVLGKYFDWGRQGQMTLRDPQELQYELCYPSDSLTSSQDTLAGKMIDRRREKLTLDALHELVTHLDGLREGRKAVIAITQGWRLFREDRSMMAAAPLGPPGIFVGPRGQPGVGSDPRMANAGSQFDCDRDRMSLAMLDNEQAFRRMLWDANRANVSFYPVDPRGLPVFDTPIGPSPPIGAIRDAAQLRGRIESLQTMAVATDGMAVVDSNDIDRGLRRIADDLSSYYLLGYSSTNSKPDGRYRKITVRVKRPGVAVRARPGYRAPSEADLAARNAMGAAARGGPSTPADAAAATATAALETLALVRPDVPVRFLAGYAWRSPGGQAAPQAPGEAGALLWVAGELDASRAGDERWREGGEATITVTAAGRRAVGSATAPLTRTARGFRVLLPADAPLEPGTYDLRISPKSSTGSAAPTEAFRVTVPARPADPDGLALGQPVMFRRGPFTGTTFQPAADLRFRRQEWIRVEVSKAGASEEVTGRILDRTGRALDIPVRVTERSESGIVWIQGDIALAPLAPGDYLVEIGARGKNTTERVLAAFRIVP